MRRLEVNYCLMRPSLNYKREPVVWPNAELTFQKNGSILLRVWKDDVEPESISEAWKELKECAESLAPALKYAGDFSVLSVSRGYAVYWYGDKDYKLQDEQDIIALIDSLRSGSDSKVYSQQCR